jgi:hypothetical protein
LLAFDRRRFHASDNFLDNSVASKKAIVTFTNIVNKPEQIAGLQSPDPQAKTLTVPDQKP